MREMLRHMVDWESHGFTVAGDSWNGQQALEMITKNTELSLVVTDLKMPVMDGLELIRRAVKLRPGLLFLVLSAYDDFEMVKEAMQLGAVDYILKSQINAGELGAVLDKIADMLHSRIKEQQLQKRALLQQTEERRRLEQIEKQYYMHRDAIREKHVRDLIWGNLDTGGYETRLQFHVRSKRLRVMVVEIDNYCKVEETDWMGDRGLLNFGIKNVIQEVLDKNGHGEVCGNRSGEYVLVLDFGEEPSDRLMHGTLQTLHAALAKGIRDCFGVSITAGVNAGTVDCSGLKEAYEQAAQACKYRFLDAGFGGRLYLFDSQASPSTQFNQAAQKKLLYLNEQLHYYHNVDAGQLYHTLRVEEQTVGFADIPAVKRLYFQYYLSLLDFCNRHDMDDKTRKYLERFETQLQDYGTLRELNNWLQKSLTLLLEGSQRQAALPNKIRQYVEQHYMEELSLGRIAERFQISQGYASRIFNKKIGSSFADYLAKVRIAHAIELMNTSNLKLYEVAERVGFANPEQFSRTFKYVMGCSAKQYFDAR